jgi:membrane-associated protease RseP (regulator of RpoE activity)
MSRLRVVSVLLALGLVGCPAVYPELGTRTRSIPAGQPLDPAPPDELHWLKFVSGRVPERTRDGRAWQANGKASPYAKLLVNGVELFRTLPESDTLAPTWPNSPRGNFRIAPTDRLRVELWDSNPINDKPIGLRELGRAGELQTFEGEIRVELEEGSSEVRLAFGPAHAVSGLGLWYELRTVGCAITRLLEGSPAERAGLFPGDEVIRIGAREVNGMSPDELRSAFNAVPFDGLKIVVKHAAGAVTEILLKEGPIYPTFAQFGPVD